MVRFHNPFPERIGQVVRQLREFIKESRIKNLFYLARVVSKFPETWYANHIQSCYLNR